ncbi:MAG: lipocalin-like domain-containing protein [Hymenobacter sp.]
MTRLPLALLLTLLLSACSTFKPVTTTRFNPPATRAELPHEEAVHPKNSLEWWYLTGHLRDQATGEEFGIEYVFFHFNLRDGKTDYQMVNVAITDPKGQKFNYDYKLRKLPRLLTDSLPLRLRERKDGQIWSFDGQEGKYQFEAALTGKQNTGYALNLSTTPTKPVLLHGGTGYENYGEGIVAGYYSYPRLATTGTLTVGGKTHQVTGELWYDRQWNCGSVVSKDVGWDWLSIQLDEPREELMINTLRNAKTGQTLQQRYLQQRHQPEHRPHRPGLHAHAPHVLDQPQIQENLPRQVARAASRPGLRPGSGAPGAPARSWPCASSTPSPCTTGKACAKVTGTHNGQPVTGKAYVEITNR